MLIKSKDAGLVMLGLTMFLSFIVLVSSGCKVSGGREFEMEIFGSKFSVKDKALKNQTGQMEYINTFDDDSLMGASILEWLLGGKDEEKVPLASPGAAPDPVVVGGP